jgi:hypothetical protein
MAIVRICEFDARLTPLNITPEISIIIIIVIIIIIIITIIIIIVYFVRFWLESKLLCISNVAISFPFHY